MTPELTALALACLLQVVQYVLMSIPANLELDPRKTLGPRDVADLKSQLSSRTARRAYSRARIAPDYFWHRRASAAPTLRQRIGHDAAI